MKNKTMRPWLIVLGVLICVALALTITRALTKTPETDVLMSSEPPAATDPVVDIDTDAHHTEGTNADPGTGADSEGPEQTIQANPEKPEASQPPRPELPDGATYTKDTPPSYSPEQVEITPTATEPEAGTANGQGQIYVPGFGYVSGGGESVAITADDIYENGNKVGDMG